MAGEDGPGPTALADPIMSVRRLGEGYASAGEGDFIAPTDLIAPRLYAANVMPGSARLVIEGRAEQGAHLDNCPEDLSQSSGDGPQRRS